jgi:transposase
MNTIGIYKRPKEKGALDYKSKDKRFYYCSKLSSKSFKNIIWTDESMIELRRNKRKIFCLKGMQAIKRYTRSKIKMMVWGAISIRGKIDFRIIPQKTKVDSKYYCNNILKPYIVKANIVHKKWILMQDNAPSHSSQESTIFIRSNRIKTLPHPPNCPDLNPIETIWSILKAKIEKLNPRGKADLVNHANQCWDEIDFQTIQSCIKNIRTIMVNVIKANGDNAFIKKKRKSLSNQNYKEEFSYDIKGDNCFYYCNDKYSDKRKLTKKCKTIERKLIAMENPTLQEKERDELYAKDYKLAQILVKKNNYEYAYF